jgi:hypothetical protein
MRMYVCTAGYLCMCRLNHPTPCCPPACLLSSLQSFPATCGPYQVVGGACAPLCAIVSGCRWSLAVVGHLALSWAVLRRRVRPCTSEGTQCHHHNSCCCHHYCHHCSDALGWRQRAVVGVRRGRQVVASQSRCWCLIVGVTACAHHWCTVGDIEKIIRRKKEGKGGGVHLATPSPLITWIWW